jgi:hypothetical protein
MQSAWDELNHEDAKAAKDNLSHLFALASF